MLTTFDCVFQPRPVQAVAYNRYDQERFSGKTGKEKFVFFCLETAIPVLCPCRLALVGPDHHTATGQYWPAPTTTQLPVGTGRPRPPLSVPRAALIGPDHHSASSVLSLPVGPDHHTATGQHWS
jgi:hypothetical protein